MKIEIRQHEVEQIILARKRHLVGADFERDRALSLIRQFHIEHPTITDNYWAMFQYSQFYLSHGVDWEDCMIASVAIRLSIPLYTRNTKHFAILPNLDLRQPY